MQLRCTRLWFWNSDSGGGAALGFPTVVPCGDVDPRRYRESDSDDGDQADPAIHPDMEWAAKDFSAAPVHHTYQSRLGDDDDAGDAQRGGHQHQGALSTRSSSSSSICRLPAAHRVRGSTT